MQEPKKRLPGAIAAGCLLLAYSTFGHAEEAVHPWTQVTQRVFVIDTAHGAEIAFDEASGSGRRPVLLTQNAVDDLDPTFCHNPKTGAVYVFYWRDGLVEPQVFARVHQYSSEEWSDEILLSEPGVDSRKPTCQSFGGDIHVGFETRAADGYRGVATLSLPETAECFGLLCADGDDLCGDNPEDCPPPYVGGFVDLTGIGHPTRYLLHVEQGKLWATWIHDCRVVGYRTWDPESGVWFDLHLEPIIDDLESTREAIRRAVVAGAH